MGIENRRCVESRSIVNFLMIFFYAVFTALVLSPSAMGIKLPPLPLPYKITKAPTTTKGPTTTMKLPAPRTTPTTTTTTTTPTTTTTTKGPTTTMGPLVPPPTKTPTTRLGYRIDWIDPSEDQIKAIFKDEDVYNWNGYNLTGYKNKYAYKVNHGNEGGTMHRTDPGFENCSQIQRGFVECKQCLPCAKEVAVFDSCGYMTGRRCVAVKFNEEI